MFTDRIAQVIETRVRRPGQIAEAAAARARAASIVGPEGRLVIVAADHPARGTLRAGRKRFAMADRADLLERLCVALGRPGVGGVLGTADVLEDLLLLGALEGKVVIGSMNRGGLAETVFDGSTRTTRRRRTPCRRAPGRCPTWPGAGSSPWSSRSSSTAWTGASATTPRPRR
jgi:hypothetical protein